jgi:phosphoesterase RecJ-like protein
MTNNSISEICEQLKGIKSVAIFCHVRPDGDALGAGLALALALKNEGKKAVMCCEDFPPEKFLFLDCMRDVQTALPKDVVFDTLISIDCADIARMGIFSDVYLSFKGTTINIDHHISNERYGKYNYVLPDYTASCEILVDIFENAGFTITKDIANLLMLGLVTDSGNFSHQDVGLHTLNSAATLVGCGADLHEINYQMFSRQPKARALLYGKVMNGIRFALDDKLTFILTTLDDLAKFGADKSVTEGFVDFPLTIEGVEVSVSLLEVKKHQYKASLRSKGKVNVNAVASTFGGGGHILASGCMLFGELEEVIEKLTYCVYQNL